MIFPISFFSRIFWKFIFLGFLQNRTFCGASGALKERAIHQRNLAEQAERWRAHSLEIYDEGRAAIAERHEVLAQREIVNQLQEHLAETQARVDDWSFGYDQEYGSEYEMVQEDQDEEGDTAQVNQVQPLMSAVAQEPPPPVTPPVVQGHVPPELLPPRQIPSFIAPLPPVQPNARDQPAPPPPPLEPPPREESTQTGQPVQQQAQGEPLVPSQQSLPSTHR